MMLYIGVYYRYGEKDDSTWSRQSKTDGKPGNEV